MSYGSPYKSTFYVTTLGENQVPAWNYLSWTQAARNFSGATSNRRRNKNFCHCRRRTIVVSPGLVVSGVSRTSPDSSITDPNSTRTSSASAGVPCQTKSRSEKKKKRDTRSDRHDFRGSAHCTSLGGAHLICSLYYGGANLKYSTLLALSFKNTAPS